MSTIMRGQAGAEDINFGLGSFPRMEGFSSKGIRKQVSAEDLPVEDILGQYASVDTEEALAELWEAAWGVVTSAADALYDGGYISNKTDWINEIMEEAANTAGQVNDETEEGVDPTDTRPVITPPAATALYIRHPSSVRPSTLAMLWVEGIGGQTPYSWDFVANNSGGSLAVQTDTGECLYTAGTTEATDTIKVTDANGVEATAQIAVSATAPVIAIFGPGEVTIGGNTARLRATGGATPHTWSFHEHITNSTLSFTQTTAVSQSTATFTSGTSTGRDTVKVLETGGQIALHPIDVISASLTDTEPVIHGATSAYIDGDELLLQVVGGETPMTWAVTGDGTLVDAADANDPEIVEMGELWDSMYGSGGSTRLKVYRPPSAATTDTITVTDADGDEDTHLIAVIAVPPSSLPTIYGAEAVLEDQVILLRVYGGTPPYTWEMLINNSGASLAEYDNDEDGSNHYTSGGSGGTESVPVQDIVRVTDANGYTDDHTISVYGRDTAPDPFPTPDPWPPWWNEDYGYLQCNIAPAGAITAGARWRVNGGTWNESGVSVEGFEVSESLNVDFKDVTEWATPGSQSVQIVAGANVVSGNYEQSSDVIASFAVSVPSSYYPGEVFRVMVTPKDSDGNTIHGLAATAVLIETASEGLVSTTDVPIQRAKASTSLEVNLFGGGINYADVVWFGTGALPAPLTITVKLKADASIVGSTTITLDAGAHLEVFDTGAGSYINETKYEHIAVRMDLGDDTKSTYWEGNVTLTPSGAGTPLISLDGTNYATSKTLAVTNGSASTDIYLKDANGNVTITAASVDDPTKTDTVVLSEMPITFVFNYIWDNANKTSLIKDSTNFEAQITAMQGGSVATGYSEDCTVESDQTSESGGTIAVAAWTNGVVTLSSLNVVFDGMPDTIILTCDDDATGLETGSRVCQTDTASPPNSEVCALVKAQRRGSDGGGHPDYPTAYAGALAVYNAGSLYDTAAGVRKLEDFSAATGGLFVHLYYGVSNYYVALTNFDDDDDLFALIAFSNPAGSESVWSAVDLIICVPPVTNYSGHATATMWAEILARSARITIPAASLPDGGSILVDLGVKKSDIPFGIPIQVLVRPNITNTFGYVSSTDKYAQIHIASVTIKGY